MRGSKKSIKSDLARIDALKDDGIDYSEIPDLSALGEEFWSKAVVKRAEPKAQVTIRVDREVLDWFRAQGKGYQTRINAVLRAYKEAQGVGKVMLLTRPRPSVYKIFKVVALDQVLPFCDEIEVDATPIQAS